MDLTLLSGVVRNRKVANAARSTSEMFNELDERSAPAPATTVEHIIEVLGRNNVFRKFSLRVHKFSFQWDLVLHLAICLASLCPFFFTGNRSYSMLPLAVWGFYHVLFLLGPRQANLVIPGFGKFKQSFKTTIEEFFSPKLLPVLSISFLLVALSLGVTGHRLGGPPLCYHACGTCLSLWSHSVGLSDPEASLYESYRHGCGYANGKELLGYYTMAQTSFILFATVVVSMAVCLAWRVADEERDERTQAEAWLKRESPHAYNLRSELIAQYGAPASAIRPEGGPAWVFFGVVAAITFTLLGWHNWYVLPPSHSATLLIILNLLTIIMTTLILHLGFFGRLLALYKRNFQRVACLTAYLRQTKEQDLESWWNCRNFVLNDDLSLDYDIGGLAVSATFLINVAVFFILLSQLFREGHPAMLEAPGSYCAYACMYITTCLIKIFSLATNTYEEQHRHIVELQALQPKIDYADMLDRALAANEHSSSGGGGGLSAATYGWVERTEDFGNVRDDGPFFIDEATPRTHKQTSLFHSSASAAILAGGLGSGGGSGEELRPLLASPRSPRKMPPSSPSRKMAGSVDNSSEDSGWQGMNSMRKSLFGPPSQAFPTMPLASSSSAAAAAAASGHTPTAAAAAAGGTGASHGGHDLEGNGVGSGSNHNNNAGGGGESRGKAGKEDFPLSIHLPSHVLGGGGGGGAMAGGYDPLAKPSPPGRQASYSSENFRQSIIEIVSQIRKYDPYPCILGIPVMPALFTTCKFYIFISFLLIGVRTMVSCFRLI